VLGSAGLFDFLQDALHLFEMVPEQVNLHAEVGEPEVNVFLCGDRHVAEPPELVGEGAVFLAGGQLRPGVP
jgi:hypothetical protein